MLDVERLSNEKPRNEWKRTEKAVNKENAKCKEWIVHNPNCKLEVNKEKIEELRLEC